MFGEKLSWKKCSYIVIRTSHEILGKHLNKFNKSQEFNPLMLLFDCLNPIQDGPFRGCSRKGGTKKTKMATLGILEIKVFWNKVYDFIMTSCSWCHQQILSHDSNYIVDFVMWPKFRNSGISMREVILNWILSGFDQKNNFFLGVSWFKLHNLGLGLEI